MPKTINGQGYSSVTPYKQEGFAKITATIRNIAYCANTKKGLPTQFLFIDCNSGCGNNSVHGKGSPLIAVDLFQKGVKIGKERTSKPFDNSVFIFCDKSNDALQQLRNELINVPKCYFFLGDNNSIEFFNYCKKIVKQEFSQKRLTHGLIYADPNASLDYPIDNINRFASDFDFRMVDILINFNTGQIKRNRNAFKNSKEHQRRHLNLIIQSIKKSKVLIRQHFPENNPFKFAHFLFTNYASFPSYKGINLHQLQSEEGQKIFHELCFTKQELIELSEEKSYCDVCGEPYDDESCFYSECCETCGFNLQYMNYKYD